MCQNTIASIFGCVLKVEGKSLLLKSPHSSDTGLVRLELYANLKALSLRFPFIVPKDAMQVVSGGKKSIVSPNCDAYEPQK